MSFLKRGCLIATSMTLGAVIGVAVSRTHGLWQWMGCVAGGVLGILAALSAAALLDRLFGHFDESVRPYG